MREEEEVGGGGTEAAGGREDGESRGTGTRGHRVMIHKFV